MYIKKIPVIFNKYYIIILINFIINIYIYHLLNIVK